MTNIFTKEVDKINILKFNIVLIILLICHFNIFSQERINKPLPTIDSEIKGELTKSIGWMINPEGQWISRPNKIPSFLENEYMSLIDYGHWGLGTDNFISYQFREVKINNKSYEILIKKYRDGYYKYPEIQKGWKNEQSVMFYVFDKNELKKLDAITDNSINLIKINILYSNSIKWVNSETYIYDIQMEIAKQIKDKSKAKNDYLIFHIAQYKTKNIVQFQIYGSFGEYKFIGGIIKEFKVDVKNDRLFSDKKRVYLSNNLFKYCYYETDFPTFNKFIKRIK